MEETAYLDGCGIFRCFIINPDFARIKKELQAPLLFDGRNLYSPQLMAAEGFAYFSVGR